VKRTAAWVALAAAFALGVAGVKGHAAGLAFAAGYAIELALSVDNVVVMLLIFSYFQIPTGERQRILFWGIAGAIVLRGLFVLVGAAALQRFAWVGPALGVVVVIVGLRLLLHDPRSAFQGERDPIVRFLRRAIPRATPALLALVLIEVTDLVFAVDSIPAVFGITRDPFIVFTSNIFAVLGLRSLVTLVGPALSRLRFLHYVVAIVLVAIGVKMLVFR
jgi:tellurite resistance protein TerC